MFVVNDSAAIVFDDHTADLFSALDALPADQRTAIGRVLTDPNRPNGRIIAVNISLETYESDHAPFYREYIEGYVVDNITGATLNHNGIVYFLYGLLDAYLGLRPVGRVIGQPYQMRLPAFPNRRREPDILVILNEHQDRLSESHIQGAPDICIEVISAESIDRDRDEKFKEYEVGGIPEYWLIDPLQAQAQFYRLGADGRYEAQPMDSDGHYQTPLLPGFSLPVARLWGQRMPNMIEVVEMARQML